MDLDGGQVWVQAVEGAEGTFWALGVTGLGVSCGGGGSGGVGICGCIGMGWGGTVGLGTRFGGLGEEEAFWALVG